MQSNPGRLLSTPSELLLILMIHLSEELLYRGVVVTLAAGWTIDRLYEAGADDFFTIAGGVTLATPQVRARVVLFWGGVGGYLCVSCAHCNRLGALLALACRTSHQGRRGRRLRQAGPGSSVWIAIFV
jgi:hypothetical protein